MSDPTVVLPQSELPGPPAVAPPAPVGTAYATRPAHGSAAAYEPTVSVPASVTAAAFAPAAGAVAVHPVEADGPAGRRVALVVVGVVLVALLGAGAFLALRPGARPTLTDTALAASLGDQASGGPGIGAAVTRPGEPGLGGSVLPVVPDGPVADEPAADDPGTSGSAVESPVVVVVPAPPTTSSPAPATPPTTAKPPATVPPSTPPTTTAPKPPLTFAHASVPAKVDCSNPLEQTPYITVSWNAPGAQSVTLSIDGPGAYRTYPGASGSDTVPFSCPGPHTYQLTATGPGGETVTKIFTATKKP
jgi:hypothetical protein